MKLRENLGPEHYLVTHRVPPSQQGVRLDAFLKGYYRKRSREQLKQAIGSGAVRIHRGQGPHLQAGRLKPSYQLLAGDEILVLSERKPEPDVDFNYRILFEDSSILVISKPANLPVHPAGRYFFNTLLVHLKTHGHQAPLEAAREYFLPHRIDKETSGVMVLAKDRAACADLVRQFAERKTEKIYHAIVRGVPPEIFSIGVALRRSTRSLIGLKMETVSEAEGGQAAWTEFKRLSIHGGFALVECRPRTGRQHQIRIHLESAGHPIVGDKLYGMDESEAVRFYERKNLSAEAEAQLLLPRHALHAARLRFFHPLTNRVMEFEAPLPDDLKAFLHVNSR